jgi:hypothetical protein
VSDRFLAVGKEGLRDRLEQYGDVRDHETQASVHEPESGAPVSESPDVSAPSGPTGRRTERRRRRWPRVGAVLAVALAAGLAAWVVLQRDDGSGSAAPQEEKSIAAVSQSGLETLARALGTPIYWAGARTDVSYELTQTPSNRIFVRYLPKGADLGTADPYLFVATFPVDNAFPVTQAEARKPGAVTIPIANGGVAFYTREVPTNVYIAFPGTDQQIQVYDPDATKAHQLVADGAIGPVLAESAPSTEATTVAAASLAELKALPGKLGHPVYWVGATSGTTYELTQTPSGRVFIRYLPAGEKAGSSTPHLFVATFPVEDALAVTRHAAQGGVKIPVGGGGVAFYSKSSPSNVYVAFPGSNYQIEVFDPDPMRAQSLVRSGKVQPIS